MARKGALLWLICLAGLPFAPFLCQKLDLWHMHTAWIQGWLILLFAFTLYKGTKKTISNLPVALWFGWLGIYSWYSFQQFIIHANTYNLVSLMPVLHMLFIILFYWTFTQLVTGRDLPHILKWLGYSAVVLIVYGYLQLFNLDQFFKQTGDPNNDILVGTIGNTSHFSAYLSCCVPILLYRTGKRWRIAQVALAGLFLVFFLKYHSVGGILAASAALLWCSWFWCRKIWGWLLGIGTIFAIASIRLIPDILSSSGRIEVWREYWQYFIQRAILGHGPGFVSNFAESIPADGGLLYRWRHLHNEFYQVGMEQGIIGLILIGFLLYTLFRLIKILPKTDVLIAMSGILIAFLINCLVNYPCHLWMIGALGLTAYSSVYVLATEGRYGFNKNT